MKQMRTLKYIVFIPLCLAALGFINMSFIYLLDWTIGKTNVWYNTINIFYFVLLIPFFWGTIWGIFKISAVGMAALLIPVSPDKKFSLYTLGILSLINCLVLIIHYWFRDVNYSWRVIFMSLIITAFIVDFSTTIVLVFSRKESHELTE